jgi:ribosomal protein S18 acetylase RimI-like enzyme
MTNINLTLRPAGPEDERFLFRVFASTREEELGLTDWDEGQKRAFLEMQHEAQSRYYREHFARSWYEVILADGVSAGRIYVDRADDEIRIIDIALLPEHRNRGIGGALVGALLDEAKQTGKPVRIHVEKFNRALRFYQRLGFATIGETGVYDEMEWSPGGGGAAGPADTSSTAGPSGAERV